MWRLGGVQAPLEFVGRRYTGWQGRFDDPRREYGTLYCAHEPVTCLREVLADLRPNTRMLAELADEIGADRGVSAAAGAVSPELRAAHVLQAAVLELHPEHPQLADVEDIPLREELARRHASLLAAHGMQHLDLSELRSHDRIVTQTIGRTLFHDRYAGVRFASHLDGRPCFALFEGRARLAAEGPSTPLASDLEELRVACHEFGLKLLAD